LIRLLIKIKYKVMSGFNFVQTLLQQATAQGSRSTILNPLGWMLSICGLMTLGAIEIKAPLWITILFGSFSGLCALLYLATYVYCLYTKQETLLRSETYSIQKLAIEKGVYGDSTVGSFNVEEGKLLNAPAKKEEQE